MKFLKYVWIIMIVVSACQKAPVQDPQYQKSAQRVILIGIDGLSVDGIRLSETPWLDTMMANGAYSMNARSVLESSSSQNWAAMVMGVGPEQNGITTNAWGRDNYILEATDLGVERIFPTVFSVIRDQLPEAEIAAIYQWGGLARLLEQQSLIMIQR